MNWDEIGVSHGTDKSSIGHDYLRHYERALSNRLIRRVLEIGVDTGASLRTWCETFPDAEVVGIDNRPECAEVDVSRATVFIGDATAPGWYLPSLDLIVDDGSHQVDDVLKSFAIFFPLLESGGVYAIEDIPVGVEGAPMSRLLEFFAQHPCCSEIWCGRSAMRWGDAWPGIVMVTKA